jgi:uncharacterized membrane protein YeaQ/YmgE (transglycosylase-associated protein family)
LPPKIRTTRFVEALSAHTAGREMADNTSSGRATSNAQRSAYCIASRFGASSPNTSVKNVNTIVTSATGALARLCKPGKQNLGIVATLLLGLVGSVIGGTIANLLGTGDIFELNVLDFIVAVIASVLLGVAEAVAGRNRTSVR